MTNRLAGESSPYLLQHAENPVDWYPWGEEAFNRARQENKPVLLSVGYSACHWCHVMAHESFEDEAVAKIMNEHFISIKVDREERPDIDGIYMNAVQTITGQGGWPLTVFLMPDGKPFYGGTYFPPEDRQGMPGFSRILLTMKDAYHSRSGDVSASAEQITRVLSKDVHAVGFSGPLTARTLDIANTVMQRSFDSQNGGFGNAPKFPQPSVIEFFLRYSLRSKDPAALRMVEVTLEKMAQGGIYDQIGGGFHRYSTDAKWLVPHFEKMLYDNALLGRLYLHAYQATHRPLFRTIAEGILDYVLREMTGIHGGFYSAQDADSEGIEGKYYVWSLREFDDVLGDELGPKMTPYYGVTREGNFEGANILYIADESAADRETVEKANAILLQRRGQRVIPGRDEKVLASWNGLMLAAMAEAACVLGRKDYLVAAIKNGTFIVDIMIKDGYLNHVHKDGITRLDGYLLDYASVIEGMLSLHRATFSGKWLTQAVALTGCMVEQFWDAGKKAFYDTGSRHEDLIVRPRSTIDNVLPSGESAAAMVLLKLALLTGNSSFRAMAEKSLVSAGPVMAQHPSAFSFRLCALDFYMGSPKEIAVVGPPDNADTSKLLDVLYRNWIPNMVFAASDPDDPFPADAIPLLQNRNMVDARPTVYVCEKNVCRSPVSDPALLQEQIGGQ